MRVVPSRTVDAPRFRGTNGAMHIRRSRAIPLRRSAAAFAAVALMGFVPGAVHAQVNPAVAPEVAPAPPLPDFATCVRALNPEGAPDFTPTDMSLQQLIGTGLFDIRAAYRMRLCEVEITVYVLQNFEERSEVFECTSDDTYRPVFPCFRVGAERQAP